MNSGGIKTIYWGEGFAVASIETQDGQTLYPTPAPGAGSYLLIAFLPMLGFVNSRGVIRALGRIHATGPVAHETRFALHLRREPFAPSQTGFKIP